MPLAIMAVNVSLGPEAVKRFARRQQVDISAFNGNQVIGYLQVTRRWMWIGLAAGPAWTIASGLTISPFPFVVGWLFGIVVAEVGFAKGPKGRRPIGMRLAPPLLVACWRIAAAVGCALAVATVARSFRAEVGLAERLAAVTALGATLAVHLLIRSLERRPLPAGPADLVGAEVAVRSRSARTLLALGAAVTLWTGLQAAFPQPSRDALALVVIVSYGLPLVAWVSAASSWQAVPAREGRSLPWAPAAAVTLAVAAFLVPVPAPAEVPQPQSEQQTGRGGDPGRGLGGAAAADGGSAHVRPPVAHALRRTGTARAAWARDQPGALRLPSRMRRRGPRVRTLGAGLGTR
ncbi:hypothetical protein ACIBHX_09110 [Nonomuraea sp. NPDC050536]|uniref:hypothetical protein n=1 Tax=Nonomuraea sp. NPDC050536 TaxID=3364366 RepID=UPI0037CA60B5